MVDTAFEDMMMVAAFITSYVLMDAASKTCVF